MNNKKMMPAYLAVAFVWFTTHFGGGFASGVQVIQYFVGYGWYAAFLPIVSQAILAFVFYYAWKFALEKKKYDYKSWALEFYKPVEKVMFPVFEIIYQLLLVTGTAIAFATGGATITAVFGTNYTVNTIIIAAIILLLCIFGANLVRSAASIMAIAIVAGMLIIYIPNVIASWGSITSNIAGLKSGAIANNSSFGSALWKALMYAGFQSAALGAYLAHSNALKDISEAKKAAVWGFILNAFILTLTTLGVLGFYQDGILTETVPALFVVMHGVGSTWMTPLISILILLGSVSTGVNLIFGITSRVVNVLAKNDTDAVRKANETKRSTFVSLIYVIFTWGVAQFGLIPLISKGYGTLGYISIFAIILPLLIKGVIGWKSVDKDQNVTI